MKYPINREGIIAWNALIQLELSELEEWIWKSSAENIFYGYVEALIAYLSHDVDSLQKKCEQISSECLQKLAKMRLAVRTRKISLSDCAQFSKYLEEHGSEFFYAEGQFILAQAYEVLGDNRKMRDQFRKAAKFLEKNSCHKKAIKAYQNSLAAETRLHPDKHFIRQHFLILKKAKAAGAFVVMGTTLGNIAREYQKLGAYLAALKFANKAVALYEDSQDSREYYNALLQRAELYVLLERITEAKVDLDFIKISPFPEIQEALRAFENIYFHAGHSINSAPLVPAWRERAENITAEKSRKALSPMEEKLLLALSKTGRDKFALIAALYPGDKDFIKLENRFNNLLNRLRKKRPNLICFDGKEYFLSDIPNDLKKAS